MISWYVIDLFLQSSIDVKRYPLSLDGILIASVFENQVARKVACNEYFKIRPTLKYSLKKRQIASRLAICTQAVFVSLESVRIPSWHLAQHLRHTSIFYHTWFWRGRAFCRLPSVTRYSWSFMNHNVDHTESVPWLFWSHHWIISSATVYDNTQLIICKLLFFCQAFIRESFKNNHSARETLSVDLFYAKLIYLSRYRKKILTLSIQLSFYSNGNVRTNLVIL